jgi:hypothetical protein
MQNTWDSTAHTQNIFDQYCIRLFTVQNIFWFDLVRASFQQLQGRTASDLRPEIENAHLSIKIFCISSKESRANSLTLANKLLVASNCRRFAAQGKVRGWFPVRDVFKRRRFQ